jgi:hypothetical protein
LDKEWLQAGKNSHAGNMITCFKSRRFILRRVPAFSNNQLPQKSTVFLKYDWRLSINGTTPAVWNFSTEMLE